MSVGGLGSGLSAELYRDVLRKGLERLGEQEQLVAELEAQIRDRTGAQHAVACRSGADGLIGLLLAAGVGEGDEVIVPAYSLFSSASCVVHVGATPVFVDVDPRSYAATTETINEAITDRTKAVLVAHLFHTVAQINDLAQLCATRDVILMEDNVKALGMRRRGAHEGLFGAGGVLSFSPSNTWGGVGGAGVVITNDADIACHVRRVFDGSGEAPWISRMDQLKAAVLLARVAVLDQEIERRQRLAGRYTERLRDLPGISVAGQDPPLHDDRSPWYVYVVQTPWRDQVADALQSAGIGMEIYYPLVLPDQPCFAHLPHGDFSAARMAAIRALALPLRADMTDRDVDVVCDVIAAFSKKEQS